MVKIFHPATKQIPLPSISEVESIAILSNEQFINIIIVISS